MVFTMRTEVRCKKRGFLSCFQFRYDGKTLGTGTSLLHNVYQHPPGRVQTIDPLSCHYGNGVVKTGKSQKKPAISENQQND